eukprot:2885345-Pleurochrysis_carterae.AAC.1
MSDAGRAAARVDCENVFSPERATPAGAEALQSFLHIATPAMAHMMSKATCRVVSCSPLPVSSSTASHRRRRSPCSAPHAHACPQCQMTLNRPMLSYF